MHLVHYEANLHSSYEDALEHEEGVVILAVQYEISNEDNSNYGFLDGLDSVREAGSSAEVDLQNLEGLLEGMSKEEFFSYHGSLTRPPCTNTVTWIVMKDRISISSRQVRRFCVFHALHTSSMTKLSCRLHSSEP